MTVYRVTRSRSFGAIRTIALSVSVLVRDFLRISLLNLLPIMLSQFLAMFALDPSLISTNVHLFLTTGQFALADWLPTISVLVASALVYIVCQAAICFAVARKLGRGSYDIRRAFLVGLSRAPRLFGIGLVIAAIYAALLFGARATLVSMAEIMPPSVALAMTLIGVLVFAIIPLCAFFVVVPVGAAENAGILRSFRRSAYLTSGRWISIFVLCLLQFALQAGVKAALVYLFATGASEQLMTIAAPLAQLVTLNLCSIIFAVAYLLLLEEKDGVDADELF